jgi:hypothetical protein
MQTIKVIIRKFSSTLHATKQRRRTMSERLLGLIKRNRISLSYNTDRNYGSVKAGNKIYRSGSKIGLVFKHTLKGEVCV